MHASCSQIHHSQHVCVGESQSNGCAARCANIHAPQLLHDHDFRIQSSQLKLKGQRLKMGFLSIPTVLLVVVVWLVFKGLRYLLAKPSSPNPFPDVASSEVKPKVLDQKKRDAVLKQSFNRDRVPENLDAIVIGSGIGGLSTAAILAKTGKKVLVLEQHDQAGGCCHTFIEKGYEFDVGIHYIGEMNYQSPTKTYVDQITNGQLEWEPLDKTYDQVFFVKKDQEPHKYDVMSGEGKWEEYLKGRFPEEADNISKFFKLVEEANAGHTNSMVVKMIPLWAVWLLEMTGLINFVTSFFKWNDKTCKEVVWGITDNQELRDIFCYCFGDFGTPPSKAGFPMQALLHKHFQTGGGAYPVGGASEIAFHIIPIIEAAGGKVLVRAEVSKIITNGEGRACGVEVKKGKEVMNISAPIIVSGAGVYNTLERLLPRDVASCSRLWEVTQKMEHGPGAMSVFVGINCGGEQLDILRKGNAWVYAGNDIDKLTLDYLKMSREEALDSDIPLLFISFPSTKDPEWEKKFPGKTTMALVTLMPYSWVEEWNKERVMKRGDEYESIKKTLGHKAVEQACQVFPAIKEHIDYVNIGTPVSNNYYLGAPQGEIYGLDHTRERFSLWNTAILRAETDIPGLYLTGQDVCSCGFTGALYGGLFSASAILKRNVMNDIISIHKRTKAESKSKKQE